MQDLRAGFVISECVMTVESPLRALQKIFRDLSVTAPDKIVIPTHVQILERPRNPISLPLPLTNEEKDSLCNT